MAFHVEIFNDPSAEYLRTGPYGDEAPRDVLQRIHNVKRSKIRRRLDVITNFDEDTIREAWSHHMAVNAGGHLWPDANHRTPLITFYHAAKRAFGIEVALEKAVSAQLVRESKDLRDSEYLRRGGEYYSVAELSDPAHEYRRLLARFEPSLIVKKA